MPVTALPSVTLARLRIRKPSPQPASEDAKDSSSEGRETARANESPVAPGAAGLGACFDPRPAHEGGRYAGAIP